MGNHDLVLVEGNAALVLAGADVDAACDFDRRRTGNAVFDFKETFQIVGCQFRNTPRCPTKNPRGADIDPVLDFELPPRRESWNRHHRCIFDDKIDDTDPLA